MFDGFTRAMSRSSRSSRARAASTSRAMAQPGTPDWLRVVEVPAVVTPDWTEDAVELRVVAAD